MAWTTPRTWVDGELVTAALMNTHLRDNLNAVPHIIRKTADESVTSNTTPQDDDHLTFSIAANEVWSVDATLWHSSTSATPNFKCSFAAPAAATFMMGTWGLQTTGTFEWQNIRSASDTPTFLTGSTGNICFLRGVVVNGANAGSARITWAQATSNATATVLKQNSHMMIQKLA